MQRFNSALTLERSGTPPDVSDSTHSLQSLREEILHERLSVGDAKSLQQHLQHCSQCRALLEELLEEAAIPLSHSAWEMLQLAASWSKMADVGEVATRFTRASLHEKGIRPIFQQDGELVEELSDGSTRRVSDTALTPR